MFQARLLTTGGSSMSTTLIRHKWQLAGVKIISCMLYITPHNYGKWMLCLSADLQPSGPSHTDHRLIKKSVGHYPQARSVILWMLTLLLPGSWCFYYINNGEGAIHHTDMRLLIMSVPCIFPLFIKRGERQRETGNGGIAGLTGKAAMSVRKGNDGGKIVEG